ncbi:MAG: aspartate aminotransferase family protein [Alphaproteobacteria bacterium]|nr:aspartate aminotransferase family protein [Alphaproteobacteria bacterium]
MNTSKSHVFHRMLGTEIPTAVRGDGAYLIDDTGKRYLDASGGPAVSCLGHSHPAVIRAIKAQIDALPYAYSGLFTTPAMEELADLLVKDAPGDLDRVLIVSSGSEAMEASLKLARQYHLETGEPERTQVIARRQSYHGNTLGALATGGNMTRRTPYEPLLMKVAHVAPCYAYRDRRPEETEEAYAGRLAQELEATIQRIGPRNVMAFVAETVAGATLGSVPAVPGYFKRIREICGRHGILLILDEVMCGMGRTGSYYACEQEGIAPDIVTVAKGLGGGYQPVGAVIASARIHKAIRDGSGVLRHGHTYLGHTTACAAALAVQKVIREEKLLDNVTSKGAMLSAALEERFGNHHHVGNIRGRGLFWSLELVRDRASKEPFDTARKLGERINVEALARGLICYPMSGTIDGKRGDHVSLAPPFNATAAHIEEAVDRLGQAVDAAIGKA